MCIKEEQASVLGIVYDLIRDVHLERQDHDFGRRILKTMEELGELSEAYINASSHNNYKNKTYEDVREELIDLLVMVHDLCATRLPHEENLTDDEFENTQLTLLRKKLDKWKKIKHRVK